MAPGGTSARTAVLAALQPTQAGCASPRAGSPHKPARGVGAGGRRGSAAGRVLGEAAAVLPGRGRKDQRGQGGGTEAVAP